MTKESCRPVEKKKGEKKKKKGNSVIKGLDQILC